MTTTQSIGRWLIIGASLSTVILSLVAIVFGRDAAAEVASDTGYGIGVALGAGWPVLALTAALVLILVIGFRRLGPAEGEPDENGDHWHDPRHRPGGRPTGIYVNGIELVEGEPNYPLIAQLEKDLLAPRTPADWVAEAEEAEVGLAVASPVVSRVRVQAVRSVTWHVARRDRDEWLA
jgi:hypothetical protein